MPAHGDFVTRGDPVIVRTIEAWLTDELGRLSAKCADDVGSLLARAPVWRFVWQYQGTPVAGVMMPSVDRVGRSFPLIVFANTDTRTALVHADALAEMPLTATTTADDALAMIAAVTFDEQADDVVPPPSGVWRSDMGENFTCDGLPPDSAFARLFGVEANSA